MKGISSRLPAVLVSIILFSVFFISLCSLLLWDFDFWWHIATGRQIVETRSIPAEDSFSYISAENRGKFPATQIRERFIMRQYWLAQIIFFSIFEYAGAWGIVLLRALLIVLTVFFCNIGLRRAAVPWLPALSLSIPIFMVLSRAFSGERPLLFTFPLSVIVFLMIDGYHRSKSRTLYLLPVIMAVWSNLHGGFIIGMVYIGVYLLVEAVRYALHRSDFSKKEFREYISVLLVSLMAASFNPNGYLAFMMFQSKHDYFTKGVDEYAPMFEDVLKGIAPADYYQICVVVILLIPLIFRIRKMALSRTILLAGLVVMGLLHKRYFVFAVTAGVMIAGDEIYRIYQDMAKRILLQQKERIEKAAAVVLSAFIIFFIVQSGPVMKKAVAQAKTSPIYAPGKEAADFIIKNNIPGRMFNTQPIGGYFIWRLYPGRQVFTDTRQIDIAAYVEYGTVTAANPSEDKNKRPMWERLLSTYDVNYLVFDAVNYKGTLWGLTLALIDNERWTPIFVGKNMFIYIRNSPENQGLIKQYGTDRETVLWSIIWYAATMAQIQQTNPNYFDTIGKCFVKLHNYEEAEKAFGHVLRLDPANREARASLDQIAGMRKSGGGISPQ